MGYIDLLIKIAAGITAIGVIIKAGTTLNKVLRLLEAAHGDLKDVKKHNEENYMSILRLTIMSNEMPIGERIVAGIKYIENGGNGEVKKFLKEKFNIDETVDEASHYKK